MASYTQVPSTRIDFKVIPPGTYSVFLILFKLICCILFTEDANTTALNDSIINISEGDNVKISCRSVGVPVPIITWKFNNQATVLEQDDTVTPVEITLDGAPDKNTEIVTVGASPGEIVSTLQIVNARYPEHDGEYTCIGTNADNMNVAGSSASVSLQVHGKLLFKYLVIIIAV